MDTITIIGIAASVFTGTSLLPQLIKIIKENKADDISMVMLLVLFTGLALWIVYGIMKQDWIIVASNAFSITINSAIVVLSLKYKGSADNGGL